LSRWLRQHRQKAMKGQALAVSTGIGTERDLSEEIGVPKRTLRLVVEKVDRLNSQ